MFWAIVRRELIDHVMSFRFFAIFTLTLILMVISVVVFSINYERAIKEHPRNVQGLVDEEGKTRLYSVPCRGDGIVQRTPAPLAFCSGTTERELPNQARTAAHGLRVIERTSQIGEMLDSSTPLDWAFVVMVILSFGTGLFTYKGISGELRDGTLALILSNPVSKATMILAKYTAALIAMAIALFTAMILSLITLQVMGAVGLTDDDWLKVGFFGIASLLYLSVFVLIGLLCSVFARSPLISAIAFLFNWTFLVFVIPNLGGIVAGLVGHVKTPLQISKMAETIPDKYPLKPGISLEEEASVNLQREEVRERLLIEYVQSLVSQVHLGQGLTRISPASPYSYAAESIVGEGTHRLMRFIENVVRFREGFFKAIIEADKEDPESEHRYVPWSCGGKHFSHRTVNLGPAKEFRDPPGTESLVAAFWDLLLLMLYNLLAFAVAFWRFARQDVAPVPGV